MKRKISFPYCCFYRFRPLFIYIIEVGDPVIWDYSSPTMFEGTSGGKRERTSNQKLLRLVSCFVRETFNRGKTLRAFRVSEEDYNKCISTVASLQRIDLKALQTHSDSMLLLK